MTPNLHTLQPYNWGQTTADHNYGEPDCTFVRNGTCWTPIDTATDWIEHLDLDSAHYGWILADTDYRLYGHEELAANTN